MFKTAERLKSKQLSKGREPGDAGAVGSVRLGFFAAGGPMAAGCKLVQGGRSRGHSPPGGGFLQGARLAFRPRVSLFFTWTGSEPGIPHAAGCGCVELCVLCKLWQARTLSVPRMFMGRRCVCPLSFVQSLGEGRETVAALGVLCLRGEIVCTWRHLDAVGSECWWHPVDRLGVLPCTPQYTVQTPQRGLAQPTRQ